MNGAATVAGMEAVQRSNSMGSPSGDSRVQSSSNRAWRSVPDTAPLLEDTHRSPGGKLTTLDPFHPRGSSNSLCQEQTRILDTALLSLPAGPAPDLYPRTTQYRILQHRRTLCQIEGVTVQQRGGTVGPGPCNALVISLTVSPDPANLINQQKELIEA